MHRATFDADPPRIGAVSPEGRRMPEVYRRTPRRLRTETNTCSVLAL